MNNHLLILLLILMSAQLPQGNSTYVPGNPAAHE